MWLHMEDMYTSSIYKKSKFMKVEFLLRHSQNEWRVECAETDQKTRPLHFSSP